MIAPLLLSASLICLPTKMINTSGFPWNDHDKSILKRARYVCSKDARYASDTPCVGMFHKKEERGFLVLCTYKRKVE